MKILKYICIWNTSLSFEREKKRKIEKSLARQCLYDRWKDSKKFTQYECQCTTAELNPGSQISKHNLLDLHL